VINPARLQIRLVCPASAIASDDLITPARGFSVEGRPLQVRPVLAVGKYAQPVPVAHSPANRCQQFDLPSAQGELIASLMAALAEFERDPLRERVRSGITAAQKRGVVFGRRPGQRVKADRFRAQSAQTRGRRPVLPRN